MAATPRDSAERLEHERERDRAARRAAARRNAEKGVGRNIEEAIRLVRSADEFRSAFQDRR